MRCQKGIYNLIHHSKILPIILSLVWLLSLLSGLSHAGSGTLLVKSFFSLQLDRAWNYKIYLPVGYENHEISDYPVIYLLHGSDGDEDAWDFIFPVIDSLSSKNLIPPLIAIVPATGTSWWVDSPSDAYESAFIQNLIPEIDKSYRTRADRYGRGIAGYSMGGYGALRYALAHSGIFGASMILSAALYYDLPPKGSSARSSGAFGKPFDKERWIARNYTSLLETYFKNREYVPLFIVTGDDDWNHEEDFSYNVEQQAALLYGKLHKEGGSPAELRIVNGGHTTKVWKKSFVEGVLYMFRYLKNSN